MLGLSKFKRHGKSLKKRKMTWLKLPISFITSTCQDLSVVCFLVAPGQPTCSPDLPAARELLAVDGSCLGAFDEAIALLLVEGPQAEGVGECPH